MTPLSETDVTILLVAQDKEDYEAINRLVKRLVVPRCKLEWCASFDIARELISKRMHDVYLVDYKLGEYSGFDILKFAEPEKRHEPFILLSDSNDRSVERQATKLGATDYLVKGAFDLEILSSSLNYALGRKAAE